MAPKRYKNDIKKIKRRYPWLAKQQAGGASTVGVMDLSQDTPSASQARPQAPATSKTGGSKNTFDDDDPTLTSASGSGAMPASTTATSSSAHSDDGNDDDEIKATSRASPEVAENEADETEWDFVLPASKVFDDCLNLYRRGPLPQQIDLKIDDIPSIFFAVATNSESILRMWVAHGGDVRAVHEPSGVPLLAFAIANGGVIHADTTPMVATLLSLGASPEVIPPEFYADCIKDLPETGPQTLDDGQPTHSKLTWCTGPVRERLAQTMNLTHRYQLWKAANIQRLYQRQKQVALIKSAEPLLGLAYFLVGQTLASNVLLQKLLTNLANPSKNRKKPLVLAFAGPSGHGKTELARRMGHLLSLEFEIVDCTVFSQEMELFGPRPGYVGSEIGSPLNNFLARNSGRRCIVFLDEFEKTTKDIHQTLLLPFDNGESEDRRNRVKVDCSQTIFILATNALDDEIQNFCQQNAGIFSEDSQQQQKAAKDLSRLLRQGFLQRFGAPLTGRISDFIPFLPFTPTEQAVVAHKFLLEMVAQVQKPVRLPEGPDQQLLGDTRLRIRREGTVCSTIATNNYHPALGARSLKTAVEQVREYVTTTYLKTDEEIREGAGIRNYVMDVKGDEVTVERAVTQ